MEESLIEDDLVSDVNEGDFSELNDTIYSSDNFLKLEKDYVYNSAKDENFSSGIVIEKDNFVIDGQGHVIDANNQANIFDVAAMNVTLKNITFINGYDLDGGAVSFQDEGNVVDCVFSNNHANWGGAVSFQDNGNLVNCVFFNNKAEYDGGAVNFAAAATLINNIFYNNNATQGGAVVIKDRASFKGNKFNNNHASWGGAIFAYYDSVTIENND